MLVARAQMAALNHLLMQHPAVRADLSVYAARRVALALPPFFLSGVWTTGGLMAQCDGSAEAIVRIHPSVLWAQWFSQPFSFSDLVFDGDIELAMSISRILTQVHWSPFEDLSKVLGDVATDAIEQLSKKFLRTNKQIAWRLIDNGLEHLREEALLLARKPEAAQFLTAVDTLRDDVERLQKRIDQVAEVRVQGSEKVSRSARPNN